MDFRKPKFAACSALLIAILSLAGCMGAAREQRVAVSTLNLKDLPKEKVVGLTTLKSEDVEFDSVAYPSGPFKGKVGGFFDDQSVRGMVKGADYKIPLEQVQRVWIMRRSVSTGRTVALVGVLGVTAAVAIGVAAASSKPATSTINGGCPFVYSWDGQQYVFDTELFGGAVARGLQRDDFSELPHLRAHHGTYRILVNDELAETDYTDRLELLAVDHRAGTSVGVDDSGKLYSLAAPQVPLSARDENGADLLPWLKSADRRIWETLPASTPEQLRHEIHLTFSKPAGAATAKLLVHAGTGEWGLRMLNNLFALYGQDLEKNLAALDSSPIQTQALKLWSANEDLYALRVWVEEPAGWQMRGMIPGGGMGPRVVQLDVSGVQGDQVHIRLQPPAGFWAINSAAIDFSPEQNLEVNRVPPQSARLTAGSGAGKDVLPELQASDGRYLTATRGDSAEIGFAAPPVRPGMTRTVFLHSNGYYRPDIRSQGPADTTTLSKIFGTRDGLARFAAERYAAWRIAPFAIQ